MLVNIDAIFILLYVTFIRDYKLMNANN